MNAFPILSAMQCEACDALQQTEEVGRAEQISQQGEGYDADDDAQDATRNLLDEQKAHDEHDECCYVITEVVHALSE